MINHDKIIEKLEQQIKIIKAHKEGKPIQFRYIEDIKWRDITSSPGFYFDEFEYRIKPNPTYRPFTPQEFFTYLGKAIYTKSTDGYLVLSIGIHDVELQRNALIIKRTYQELLADFHLKDLTPCGMCLHE